MTTFTKELSSIDHYQKYPNLIPWIGDGFNDAKHKLLILGESHYLDEGSHYHHNPQEWYAGIDVSAFEDLGWMKTANIIRNGINNGWKQKSKLIYKNLSKALIESKVEEFDIEQPFQKLCYLNYFQRPAEKTGKSIKVSDLDSKRSSSVVNEVIAIVKPHIVVFSSTLAWNHAKKSGLISELKEGGIKCERVPHAGMPWWNRVSKKYDNKTGKYYFIDFIKDAVS
ncbi:hypothetical protein [Colwellia sp. MB3u-4]|uniref:hypothetical protein n=1 Tax=Colwellia sp. MB3u-4 TaxID=2759822 RepID=UPI0015F5BC50|nr:hypothetical protein [Colwellia sp. MB3u-4]MBA6287471.1 hypothetical protein [Colwellia sp. MB3u-4]